MASESVLTFITKLFLYFFDGIVGLINGATSDIANLIGSGFSTILGDFVDELSNTGIWAIPLLVLLVGIMGLGVYLILDFSRMVDDFL
jgi:hypothetical protein